ncbi:MAG: glycosyltransferase family 39 protein, partial [Burkholderiales bacterium]|nr:glycosyltransferase family 39 protein [Burkholderiales bacterium]
MFVWLLATAGWRPLAVPDEGRYAGVAWEMIRSGDWLTPTLNGLPFFHKPPLFYWITGISLQGLGQNMMAARMASLLGAWMGAVALWLFVRRWVGPQRALWASLVLLTQPFFYGGAQYANLDTLVAGCITATILMAVHAVLLDEHGLPYRAALWGAYALAGLGLLAKGL